MTVGELADIVLGNAEILAMNDGGITLTGGEPLAQPGFVTGLPRKVKLFVHTAVETSGHVPNEVFKSVLEYLDLVLFDIKHMDPVVHKRHTGVDNRLILENLRTLIESGREFVIRVPLIPGVNDTEENTRAMAEALKGARSRGWSCCATIRWPAPSTGGSAGNTPRLSTPGWSRGYIKRYLRKTT